MTRPLIFTYAGADFFAEAGLNANTFEDNEGDEALSAGDPANRDRFYGGDDDMFPDQAR